ncbi:hypothetical protein AALA69_07595 [Eggerthellaceae bacterium 24-137]
MIGRGEAVTVEERREAGRDAMGCVVYETSEREVAGVLVQPGATADIEEGNRSGRTAAYTLLWPKADGSPVLDGLRVRVRGEWLAVIGSPRPYDAAACPTAWNMQVKVGCVHG